MRRYPDIQSYTDGALVGCIEDRMMRSSPCEPGDVERERYGGGELDHERIVRRFVAAATASAVMLRLTESHKYISNEFIGSQLFLYHENSGCVARVRIERHIARLSDSVLEAWGVEGGDGEAADADGAVQAVASRLAGTPDGQKLGELLVDMVATPDASMLMSASHRTIMRESVAGRTLDLVLVRQEALLLTRAPAETGHITCLKRVRSASSFSHMISCLRDYRRRRDVTPAYIRACRHIFTSEDGTYVYTMTALLRAFMGGTDDKKLAACSCCGRDGAKRRCGGCLEVTYCDQRCQISDWNGHREKCLCL